MSSTDGDTAQIQLNVSGPETGWVTPAFPSWAVDSNGNNVDFPVFTNKASWTAVFNQPWITLSNVDRDYDGAAIISGVDGSHIYVSVDGNWDDGAGDRSGTVTLTAGGASSTISITQSGETGIIMGATPSRTIDAAGTDNVSFDVYGYGDDNPTVEVSDSSWLYAYLDTWSGGGIVQIDTRIAVAPNSTGRPRYGIVTVIVGTPGNLHSVNTLITQLAE